MKYLVVVWIQNNPILDGAKYFDTKGDAIEYVDKLKKIDEKIKTKYVVPNDIYFPVYKICRIEKGNIKQIAED